jgi:hypothetical protein
MWLTVDSGCFAFCKSRAITGSHDRSRLSPKKNSLQR